VDDIDVADHAVPIIMKAPASGTATVSPRESMPTASARWAIPVGWTIRRYGRQRPATLQRAAQPQLGVDG
jgi:hypothetical protein